MRLLAKKGTNGEEIYTLLGLDWYLFVAQRTSTYEEEAQLSPFSFSSLFFLRPFFRSFFTERLRSCVKLSSTSNLCQHRNSILSPPPIFAGKLSGIHLCVDRSPSF